MGSLVTVIVYAVIAGGALLAIHSFLNGYEEKGAAAQLKADTPIINACKVDRDTATKANASLKLDVDRIAKERDDQSAAVAAQAAEAARLAALKDKALANAQAALKSYAADNASLASVLAAAQPQGKTCAQTLAAVDDNLRTLARKRVQFNPTGPDGDGGNSDGGAGKGAGADTLRIH